MGLKMSIAEIEQALDEHQPLEILPDGTVRKKLTEEQIEPLLRRLEGDLKTMAQFECESSDRCGRGAVCNGCWAKRAAGQYLFELEKLRKVSS